MPDIDGELWGFDLFGDPVQPHKLRGPLAQRFIFPPFTLWDAASGVWQERKRAWLGMGIKSEVSRADIRTYDLPDYMQDRQPKGDAKGVSVFDPVLCELAYRWFCPPGGSVLDPFAGGSVRGVVACKLGRPYFGVELRVEQVEANYANAQEMGLPQPHPTWVQGDSSVVLRAPTKNRKCDMIFSCPPYGDLEVYSDDKADLSNMGAAAFREAHRDIIAQCARRLADNRFAVYVVGDYRDKRTGLYTGFVGHTIDAFARAGMGLYNEAILTTPRGSLPMRVSAHFDRGRKLGKMHQNVLVFVKGDARAAADACVADGEGDILGEVRG